MPNHTCCVPGCLNRHSRTKDKGVRYYRFPADLIVRRMWQMKICRERTFVVTPNTRVCSEHFVGGIIDENNPIPTLFPWKKPEDQTPKRPPPKERITQELTQLRSPSNQQDSGCQQTLSPHTPKTVAIQCCSELKDTAVQVESDRTFVYFMLERIGELENQNTSLKSQLINQTFCIERFSDNDHDIAYYTGFPSYESLMAFWCYLGEKVDYLTLWRGQETKVAGTPLCPMTERKLKPMDEFFMCLMRLRLGLQVTDLAFRFCISPASVSRIFTTWINFLYLEFKAIDFQPSRQQIDRDMPLCFKTKYRTTRLILDATEVPLETPSSLEMQSLTWSSYKNTNTLKGLIGITPTGYISFVSSLYCGNISDKRITAESGVLDTLQPGDGLMADRGFDIGDECAAHGIDLNIPPFRYGRGQLSACEVVQTRRIASLRIHVERAITR